ncbi:MAG: Crp/Fnr family transcriptional regulator [Alphaproteobacteria bacterium]|nr:Crp/Fnr family transcriptional regulator [Alphaproteobacteria bacterium]
MAEPSHSLSGIPLLRTLDDAARQSLEQRCRWQRYSAQDEIIGHESDSRDVYFIITGRVRVVNHSLSGKEIAFHEMDAGSYFGELAAIDEQPRSATVVALNDSLLASMSPDTFINLLQDHPQLAIEVLRELAQFVRVSTNRIMELSTLGAHNRVHSEILRQARALAGETGNSARISPIPVHADIASRVSTTRETVARVLSDLAKQGVVKREKNALVVNDLEQLEKIVNEVRDF